MTHKELATKLKDEAADSDLFDEEEEEWFSMIIDALEKQIPKKPTNFSIDNNGYTIYDCECPSCEQSHRELFPFAFCIHCGQALEWEK